MLMDPPIVTQQAVNSPTFVPAPLDGSLSLPEIYDYHAQHNTNHPLFVFEGADGKIHTILWPRAVQAIHTAARLVASSLHPGERPKTSLVVAILAHADTFVYFTMIMGIIRAGYIAFPISVRNSATGVAHLLEKTGAKHLFITQDQAMQKLASDACQNISLDGGRPVVLIPMPTFDSLFTDGSEFEPLPPMEHPDENATGFIIHSSGSTAFPKPVHLTHRILIQWARLPYYGDIDLCGLVLSVHAVPMFHAMGTIQTSWVAGTGMILSAFRPCDPPMIPSPDFVFSGAVATGSSLIFCVPAFIEAWSRDPERIKALQKFKAVIFAGAPMQKECGDMLVGLGVPLVPFYAATEFGCAVTFSPAGPMADGWDYFKFSPHCRPEFIPYGDSGSVFQLVMVDSPCNTLGVLNTEVNGAKAYDTNDLLQRHPTNPDLWRVYGRADDQIMHSTGEKTNPVPMETIFRKNPKIASAVMFGRGRFHAGVLMEPIVSHAFDVADLQQLAAFRNDIWPTIEEANQIAPTHSRIFKEMILVAHPEKPFEYTPKGTPRRHVVIAKYEQEIEQAYAAVEESSQIGLSVPEVWDSSQSLSFVRMAVEKVMSGNVEDDDDLFLHGCDSLQATWIRNTILHALRQKFRIATQNIPHNFVYTNPTIRRLGLFVAGVAVQGDACGIPEADPVNKADEMRALVEKYSANFRQHSASSSWTPGDEAVLLTGTTGGLGSYILERLLLDTSVSRVYALNRKDKQNSHILRERQASAFGHRGIQADLVDSTKLVLLEGDIALPKLGIDEVIYEEMRTKLTSIIHNAWRVNFNVSLSSLEPLIAGTRHLIDLALSSPRLDPPRFCFASSIGVFRNYAVGYIAPETPLADPAIAIGTGYSESKWAAESVLVAAAEKTNLKPVIIRVGQMSGGYNGCWNHAEWLPALVRSGQVLKCLPDVPGHVSWIPLHVAASVIVEMRKGDKAFVHLAHPNPVPWTSIFKQLSAVLRVPLVPYAEWFRALEGSSPSDSTEAVAEAANNPALRLLEFYQARIRFGQANGGEALGFPMLCTSDAINTAPSLQARNLPQLGQQDVEKWLEYWFRIGFLTTQ